MQWYMYKVNATLSLLSIIAKQVSNTNIISVMIWLMVYIVVYEHACYTYMYKVNVA